MLYANMQTGQRRCNPISLNPVWGEEQKASSQITLAEQAPYVLMNKGRVRTENCPSVVTPEEQTTGCPIG